MCWYYLHYALDWWLARFIRRVTVRLERLERERGLIRPLPPSASHLRAASSVVPRPADECSPSRSMTPRGADTDQGPLALVVSRTRGRMPAVVIGFQKHILAGEHVLPQQRQGTGDSLGPVTRLDEGHLCQARFFLLRFFPRSIRILSNLDTPTSLDGT